MAQPASLRDRVQLIVDRFHKGNVSDAARALQIPKRTLANLLSGHTASPRVGILTAIARMYGTSVGWLMDGEGQAPGEDPGLKLSDMLAWAKFVERMDLSKRAYQALFHLPWASGYAIDAWLDAPHFVKPATERTLRFLALNLATSVWLLTMEKLEKAIGPERLREALEQHVAELSVGFGPAAEAALQVPGAKEAALAAVDKLPTPERLRARVADIAKLMEQWDAPETSAQPRRKRTEGK